MARVSDVLAANVRAERARRRWSQADLAERVGLARSTIGAIETGRVKISADYIPVFCQAFDVTLAELLHGADPGDLQAMGL